MTIAATPPPAQKIGRAMITYYWLIDETSPRYRGKRDYVLRDTRGNVIARLPTFTQGSIETTVQGTTGFTPYVTSGNNTVLAVSLLFLAFGFAFGPGRDRSGRATVRNGTNSVSTDTKRDDNA